MFSAIDGRSHLVLVSSRMSAETEQELIRFLDRCALMFGEPLATLRDLSPRIKSAIEAVFPHQPDLICHYHFLAAVGEKLCRGHHGQLTNYVRKLKMKSSLRNLRKDLIRYSKNKPSLDDKMLMIFLQKGTSVPECDHDQLKRILSYLVLMWLKDYGADLKGEYMPFDLPELAFYRRGIRVYDILVTILHSSTMKKRDWQVMYTILRHLEPLRKNPDLVKIANRLIKSEQLFNQLRSVLAFDPIPNRPFLRQHNETPSTHRARTLEKRLIELKKECVQKVTSSHDPDTKKDASIVLKYLDKYWQNLFGHVIFTTNSKTALCVERTNNVLECQFGQLKHRLRRKLGTKKISRNFQATQPEQLLVQNLNHQDYVELIYNGNLGSMPKMFGKYATKNQKKSEWDKQKNISILPTKKKYLRSKKVVLQLARGIEKMVDTLQIKNGRFT